MEGTSGEVWDKYHRDNLKIIPAEGYYDYEFVADTHKFNCVDYDTQYLAIKRNLENPFCGGQDQEYHYFLIPSDTVLYTHNELETWRKIIGNQYDDQLPLLGDNLDAFSTYTKINMGTNPSTCNAKTFHNKTTKLHSFYEYLKGTNPEKNVQTTYLTGLSIEMTPIQGTGNFLVSVRWDDYDITNDTRWTGKIALKDTAILTTGNTITLAQNRTVAQPTRNPETGLFAGRTRWICENGSYFRQDSASALILTENSSVTFKNGSRYDLSKGARVEIHAGCSLTVQPGAKIQLKGIVEVDSGGVLILYDTAKMGSLARLIIRPGGKLVVDGGTLTSAYPGELWQGIEVVGDRTKRQLAQYQGIVELKNGARIENALCAIRTGLREDTVTFATTGGIISATNATFKNNRQSVMINSYAYTAPSGGIANYNSTFSRCTFTIDNSNLFAANNTAFAEHVRLWDVKGVTFEGCTFNDLTSSALGKGRGIYAADAGVLVNTYCPPQPTPVCECPETDATYSFFSGFTTAVEVNTSGNPYAVRTDEVRFSNNSTGVSINGNHFATVTRCQFNLDQWPASSKGNIGLYLAGCSGYTVEGNTFKRTIYPTSPLTTDNSTGISVSTSGITANSLYRNVFEKLTKGIHVIGINGSGTTGLRMTCNDFSNGKYDIHIAAKAKVANYQGTAVKGADNIFISTITSSIFNESMDVINYYYGNGSAPISPYQVTTHSGAEANLCASTLCDGGIPGPGPIDALEGDMDADTYYTAVRTLMSDTVLDLNELEQWHTAAQSANFANFANIGDPYSLTETRFMEGYVETFAGNAEDVEMANYAEFHAMKLSLRDNVADNDVAVGANDYSPLQPGGHINWYALTPAQIAQLQTIAERNTGRASVMAKGVLCFFYGICYEDEWDGAGAQAGTPQQGDDTTGTRAKRTAMDTDNDATLSVYPNPTDDVLFIELSGGAGIANVALYDLQGRIINSPNSFNSPTLDVKSVPAGVYILRVTDADGKEYHRKIVKK